MSAPTTNLTAKSDNAASHVKSSERTNLYLVLFTMVAATFVGMLAVGIGLNDGGRQLGFAWLLNVWFVLSICLGAMFFVGIQHITRSGWSVTLRRVAEVTGASIVGPVILLIPVLIALLSGHGNLFSWNDPSYVAGDEILEGKHAFLNAPFFSIRFLVYAMVWVSAGVWMLKTSQRQDRTGDKSLTLKMERRSAPILIFLALTTTFASFDWLMSLDPHWFSTIYGIYVFSGGMTAALAVLSIVAAVWVKSGRYQSLVTAEHLHDITKMMYGFNCFWAYIAFSQYLLIWYANIPEETIWLKHRQAHGWDAVTMVLMFGHFFVPFVVLMPRVAKRNTNVVIAVSSLLLIMHWLDLYWLVYPQFNESPILGSMEILGAMFAVSFTAVVAGWFAKGEKLIPAADPRLPEAVSHHVA
ncbi:MAG: quinol:cytochrome C oxidoreductase [Fuerstiella sp.]